MPDTAKKTNINVKKIAILYSQSEVDPETHTGSASFAVLDLTGRARSFTDTPAVNSADLYGSGELQETVYLSANGSLTLAVNYLTAEERQVLFGETDSNGTNVVTGNETPNEVCVALMTECTTDGSIVNLYKYFNVTFQPNEESVQQIENGVTFSTVQITGTYRKSPNNNMVKAVRRHVNANASGSAELISGWFSMPNRISST